MRNIIGLIKLTNEKLAGYIARRITIIGENCQCICSQETKNNTIRTIIQKLKSGNRMFDWQSSHLLSSLIEEIVD